MSQRAHVYERKSSLFVVAYSKNTDGIWFCDGECAGLSWDTEDGVLGDAVCRALDRSRSGVDLNLREAKGLFDPVLKAARVRGWRTFVYGAASVAVSRDGVAARVTPSRNNGARGGFVDVDESSLEVVPVTPEAVGAAVRRALELCE